MRRIFPRNGQVIGAVLMTASVLAGPAMAQEGQVVDQRNVGVQERARPAYDAAGVRAGGFLIYPQASYSGTFNDNIYAADTNETEDYISNLTAGVDVNSTWSRHALNLTGTISKYLYADNSDENRLDWNVGANGRLDVTRNTNFSGGVSYSQNHEDRGAPNSPAAASKPVEYKLFQTEAKFHQGFNRLFAELGGKYSNYDYKDGTTLAGANLDQDYRDRDVWDESLRLGYMVSPDTSLFVEGSLNQRNYDQKPPVVAVNRDSNGYAVVGGAEFRLTNLASGEIYAGYHEQDYDALSDISGLDYGASIQWFVTPLTTVGLNASSTIEETTSVGSSGYTDQNISATVDHELMRNVILSGNLGYSNNDYEGIIRNDDIITGGLGVRYLVNRNAEARVGYDYTNRNSDVSGLDYTRNEIGFTVTLKL